MMHFVPRAVLINNSIESSPLFENYHVGESALGNYMLGYESKHIQEIDDKIRKEAEKCDKL